MTDIVLYSTEQGDVSVKVLVDAQTLWLTQLQLADLFAVQKAAISKHLKNIFATGELDEVSVVSNLETTANDGKKYKVKYYNLDAIIAVGYRVNSKQATGFRIWATQLLKEYMLKGFIMDDERLKQGKQLFGQDYFRELLERVRSIRASERRIYQQITDIFAECSIDYNRDSPVTQEFYATVQNKFHYAITGNTAAEIIVKRVDKKALNMGLSTWKNAPKGRILKSDTHIAKNYLSETEIKKLERTIGAYFDYIENQIEQQNRFTMQQLAESVNRFLDFNNFKVLADKGSISNKQAIHKANEVYQDFNRTQKIESDFDKTIKRLKDN